MSIDLSEMSKEQKLELLAAIEEKKRRNRLKKDVFKPHPGQLKVIESEANKRFVFCGNGWGKTATASNIAKWRAEGYNPITKEHYRVPRTVTIVLDHPDKVEETWLPELRKWMNIDEDMLKKNGKPYYNEVMHPNGSRFKFMFHEQPDMIWESTEFEDMIYDEPPPRRIFIAVGRGQRSRKKETSVHMFGTPINQPWLRKQIYEPWIKGELEDVECFRGSTEENESNLRDGYMKDFGQFLTEEEKLIRFGGRFSDLSGLALAHLFSHSRNVIKRLDFNKIWDMSNPCVVAVDPHPSKKHVAILLGVDRYDQLYYIKEIAEKKIARQFATQLKKEFEGYRIIQYICDSLGSAETTSGEGYRSFIDVCNEVLGRGRMRATTFKEKSDEDFIDRIRTVIATPEEKNNFGLKIPKLMIVEGNLGIVDDIENVSWQKDREKEVKDKLDIRQHDHLACLKYALATNLFFKRGMRMKGHRHTSNNYGMGRR